MSQASKQVDWCIKKARKEIEECSKQNKRPKHRGLLEINPDIEKSNEHLAKAEHYLKGTEYLMKGNFSDISTSTLFYGMYHCFLAIASKFGYESGNQTCTISLIEYLKEQGKIDIDQRYIDLFKYEDNPQEAESIIDLRETYTYGIKIKANLEKIDDLLIQCKELIDLTKNIVQN